VKIPDGLRHGLEALGLVDRDRLVLGRISHGLDAPAPPISSAARAARASLASRYRPVNGVVSRHRNAEIENTGMSGYASPFVLGLRPGATERGSLKRSIIFEDGPWLWS
jgi:hypothetical protein